jgi:hypothetical protein
LGDVVKRRLEIVVETTRRVTLRRPGAAPTARCGQCSEPLVSTEEAVAVTGLSSRTIHRLVEAGEVHFAETPSGALLVCPNSVNSNSERKINHGK